MAVLETQVEHDIPRKRFQEWILRTAVPRQSVWAFGVRLRFLKTFFTDKRGGTQADRPGLKEALSYLRESDALVVWKLDRLGRSVKGLIDLVNEMQRQRVHLKSLTDGIDTQTPAGRFFFHVMASLAQMERELIIERTRAGLEAAKRRGRVGGRKRRMTETKIEAAKGLLAAGTSPREVAQSLGVSVPTLYRCVPASGR